VAVAAAQPSANGSMPKAQKAAPGFGRIVVSENNSGTE
jgi:hypothetical protein